MTPTEAVEIVTNSNPKLNVYSCKDYGSDYLITAFETSNDWDPFYLVDKKTGIISPYTIAQNPSRYYNAKDLKY